MIRAIAVLAALCALGCEDTYVREHIIDNFVCVYMPWWMGECDGEEVTNKVMGVLDHGLISAQADCVADNTGTMPSPVSLAAGDRSYHVLVQKLLDGSVLFYSSSKGGPNPLPAPKLMRLCELGSACASGVTISTTELLTYQPGAGPETVATVSVAGGLLSVSASHPLYDSIMGSGTNPVLLVSADITGVCTGFNLAAFGVEE